MTRFQRTLEMSAMISSFFSSLNCEIQDKKRKFKNYTITYQFCPRVHQLRLSSDIHGTQRDFLWGQDRMPGGAEEANKHSRGIRKKIRFLLQAHSQNALSHETTLYTLSFIQWSLTSWSSLGSDLHLAAKGGQNT